MIMMMMVIVRAGPPTATGPQRWFCGGGGGGGSVHVAVSDNATVGDSLLTKRLEKHSVNSSFEKFRFQKKK